MPGPLHGTRVLDLSRILAGPWASQLLADLGAEVIKVEKPGAGDDTRTWGPPFVAADESGGPRGESAYFMSTNRGKKSVTIDFSKSQGQSLIKRLTEKADILLENFKVGGLAKLGLGPDDLFKLNPRLIYCSITGFGQTGPYRARAGYDFLVQAMGGLMSVTGEPGGQPMKAGVAVADLFTGMYAATACLGALTERARSGLGQHIDIALFDVQIATLANQIMSYLVSGQQPPRLGNAHPSIVPYQVVPTQDSHAILAIGNDDQFGRFCEAAGIHGIALDAKFGTNPDRVANRQLLIPIIEAVMRTKTTKVWIATLEAAGVPCGPINQFSDLETNEQVIARGIFKPAVFGMARSVANPIRYSRTQVQDDRASPLLGADTEEILRGELGLVDADIVSLRHNLII